MFGEEKPVSAPCNVAYHSAMPWHFDGDMLQMAITWNIFYPNAAIAVQSCADHAHGGFNLVRSRPNASEMGESCHYADGAMPAHAQISNIVEEDDSGCVAAIGGFPQKRSHQNIRTARFVHHSRPEAVEFSRKTTETLGERAAAEVRTAFDHHTRWLTCCMGVEDMDGPHRGAQIAHKPGYFLFFMLRMLRDFDATAWSNRIGMPVSAGKHRLRNVQLDH